ncbi:hypothetical protein [Sphingomonas abaci]|uniref:Uncharacterized protein n=1 Tax=Sphingomonas abaci TaxID=237611 RepID=A0A7W7EXW2_9SPHN|nr:hypothetical protein [Sphingomonas abaci]MBB4617449.1 hypothetical protein [Sphingomonas abaci]
MRDRLVRSTADQAAEHVHVARGQAGDPRPAVRKIDITSFSQPIKPLPAAAVLALTPTGNDDDWQEF